MTEYRVIDFDDATDDYMVVYTHDGEQARIIVPAVIEDDGETVDVVASKDAIQKAIREAITPVTRTVKRFGRDLVAVVASDALNAD